MVNKGKTWEGVVRSTLSQIPELSLDRYPDPQGGYKGARNICDFGVYRYPYFWYLECKTVKGNTLPFVNLSQNQWDGLLEKSGIFGCSALVLVWFSDWDAVVAINIEYLENQKRAGKKSFNIKELEGYEFQGDFVEVPCKVPRINPKIPPNSLMGVLTRFAEKKWKS